MHYKHTNFFVRCFGFFAIDTELMFPHFSLSFSPIVFIYRVLIESERFILAWFGSVQHQLPLSWQLGGSAAIGDAVRRSNAQRSVSFGDRLTHP